MATPDFPPEIPASPSDDPGKPWRVVDGRGNAADYPNRRDARDAMDEVRGSSASYVRRRPSGVWRLYETLLRG